MKKIPNRFKLIAAVLAAMTIIAACGDGGPDEDSSQEQTQEVTERYSSMAIEAVPYPLEAMEQGGWLERRNLGERLVRYADPNKISYIYLFSEQGQLIGNYTIKGKVSNTSSQMTTSEVVVDGCGSGEYCAFSYDAPMDDGTWGPSEDAIFFFTTEGVMIQWNGPYVLADTPLNLTSTPILVYNENSEPSSVGDESVYGGN